VKVEKWAKIGEKGQNSQPLSPQVFAVHPNGGSFKIRLTDLAGMRSSSAMISKQSPRNI
jgi:hypothetical protein